MIYGYVRVRRRLFYERKGIDSAYDLNCQQVFVDFSAATHLKTIGLQAFFQVRGLIKRALTSQRRRVKVIEGNAFKQTGITGGDTADYSGRSGQG